MRHLLISRRLAVASLVIAGGLAGAQSARADVAPVFGRETVLPGSGGAEPSLAIDYSPASAGKNIYVSSISPGANLWHSLDGGQSWSQPVAFDTSGPQRGNDADVTVGPDGTVYVVDLNIAYSLVQSSTDHGHSFSSGSQTTPEADRPWITAGPNGAVHVIYHDFATETVLDCMSPNGGTAFLPCVDTFGANNPTATEECTSNTDIGKALRIDPTDGSLNIVFSCSTANQAAQSPPYGPVHDYYMSKSTDGGVTWNTYTMYVADLSNGKSPTLSNFWTSFAIDSAGNYYALMDGTYDDNNVATNPYHVYLLTSKDHGQTWSQTPVQGDYEADGKGTHVLSDLAVTSPGNVDVVFYGTTVTGEPNGVCGSVASQGPCPNGEGLPDYTSANRPGWRVSLAQSVNALDANPTFMQTPVTSEFTHFGEICTNGIVCGQSDRTLLDYISVGVDCTGDAHVAFAGNPQENTTTQQPNVYEVDQTAGSTISPPAACPAPATSTPELPLTALAPIAGLGAAVALAMRRRSGLRIHSTA
ncbi:MAG: sialidase family protein [Candidatus Dormibacteria bacterium]